LSPDGTGTLQCTSDAGPVGPGEDGEADSAADGLAAGAELAVDCALGLCDAAGDEPPQAASTAMVTTRVRRRSTA
jgi:hypothetical protein